MSFNCDVCNLKLVDKVSLTGHLTGKKHKIAARKHEAQLKIARDVEHSIFVTRLPPKTTWEALSGYFSHYGTIEDGFVKPDRFGIVQFKEKSVVQLVLRQNHFLFGRRLLVDPRKMKPEEETETPENDSINKVNASLTHCTNIIEQMETLVEELKLSPEDLKNRDWFRKHLESIFAQKFEMCLVEIFGSSSSHLGMHGCDLDICVSLRPDFDFEVDKMHLSHSQLTRTVNILFSNDDKILMWDAVKYSDLTLVEIIRAVLARRVPECKNLFVIRSKRCPIVRFHHSKLKLNCDISIKSRLAVRNTALIRLFTEFDRRALLLFFAVRYWAKLYCISGGGGSHWSNYAIVMLGIFFLQNTKPPVLPTVQKLCDMAEPKDRSTVSGIDCSFCSDRDVIPKSDNTSSPDELLQGFFKFYKNFDFKMNAISVRTGETILKCDLETLYPGIQDNDKHVCIQDPFDLKHNITAPLTPKVIEVFYIALRHGADVTTNPDLWNTKEQCKTSDWGLLALYKPDFKTSDAGSQSRSKKKKSGKKTLLSVLLNLNAEIPSTSTQTSSSGPTNSPQKQPSIALNSPPKQPSIALNSPPKQPSIALNSPPKEISNGFQHERSFDLNIDKIFSGSSRSSRTKYMTNAEKCNKVRSVVHQVMSVALQFQCTPLESFASSSGTGTISDGCRSDSVDGRSRSADSDGSRSRSNPRKFRRLDSEGHRESTSSRSSASVNNQGNLIWLFTCTLLYPTWMNRKRYYCTLIKPIIQTEADISLQIMDKEKMSSLQTEHMLSFFCVMTNNSDARRVTVKLGTNSKSRRLQSEVFTFLCSYVKKIVTKSIEEEIILSS